jgi:hypothetical protein
LAGEGSEKERGRKAPSTKLSPSPNIYIKGFFNLTVWRGARGKVKLLRQ